ncbi:helix-turn-helix domain-containing protein [Azospirillum halopraeferens]|uniref:helix-turn-helix domain-containing protein n=1 Tax=Azospirillum halopraeferens TaxID=34010 RepID=UPI0006860954|nr:type II toxin-antitoxin system MqsA family antitoxin [Azospirillum halopraeferens]
MVDRPLTEKEKIALAAMDWQAIDAMTDADIARQIAENPDAPPDLSDAPADAVRVVHPSGGVSVRGIRAKLKLSQREFAERFGFPLGTVRDWEQGRYQPEASTRTLLFVIEREPDLVAEVVGRTGRYAA